MSFRSVEVAVPNGQSNWFRKQRVYPARLQINQRSAIFADTIYELHHLPSGWTAVSKTVKDVRLVIGEFSKESVRHTISRSAERDVRVLRAAAYGAPYLCPVACETEQGDLVHPGACWRTYSAKLVIRTPKFLYATKEEETRCIVCEEGFE